MKNRNLILSVVAASAVLAVQAQATTISQWTFENNPSTLNNSASYSGSAADFGNGIASGFHASKDTDWTLSPGDNSATSLTANNWGVGDYWQFHLNTLGFQDISLAWNQVSSSPGPGTFALFWSLTEVDSSFAQIGSAYSVPQPFNNWKDYTFDLTGLTALNNSPDVFFRLVNMNGLRALGGNDPITKRGTHQIDNFTVQGDQRSRVPDALPFGFTACFLIGFLALSERILKTSRVGFLSR